MAQDAREANSRVAEGAGREDRRSGDERYAQEPYADPREDEGRYDPRDDRRYDPRDDRRYDPRDDRREYEDSAYGYDYEPEDQPPWDDEGAYDEPPPYEDEDQDYSPPDDDYDPRYDPGYRRR
jgi:CTD kinase subunit alpha